MPPRKQHLRSRNGCIQCKRRKIKVTFPSTSQPRRPDTDASYSAMRGPHSVGLATSIGFPAPSRLLPRHLVPHQLRLDPPVYPQISNTPLQSRPATYSILNFSTTSPPTPTVPSQVLSSYLRSRRSSTAPVSSRWPSDMIISLTPSSQYQVST